MKNQYIDDSNSNSKTYYLPGDPSKTPLTREEYNDLMRPFWKQRKQLQRAGECNSPAWHVCMCDCADCPYHRSGNTVSFVTLGSIGDEVADPNCMEDNVADSIFKKQIRNCLKQMDPIDQIVIRCVVLHERDVTERQLAALISKIIGRDYSHQAVHKRIPAASKRLADMVKYKY